MVNYCSDDNNANLDNHSHSKDHPPIKSQASDSEVLIILIKVSQKQTQHFIRSDDDDGYAVNAVSTVRHQLEGKR